MVSIADVGMLAAVALFTVVGISIAVDPYNFTFIKQFSAFLFVSALWYTD